MSGVGRGRGGRDECEGGGRREARKDVRVVEVK